jgi:hypothetical protein
VSWLVDSLGGEAILTFAYVRRFPYQKLHDYLELLKTRQTSIRLWHPKGTALHQYGLHFIGNGTCHCPATYPWWVELTERCKAA